MTSEEFHKMHYHLYDKIVRITFKDNKEFVGLFNDEFYEDNSILVSCETIKIGKIAKMVLFENE